MGLRRHARSGAIWTASSTAIVAVVQVIQIAALARLLAPDQFGLMALALVVTGLVQSYADLGLSAALVQKQDATPEQISSVYWLNVGAGFVAFLTLVAAAGPVAWLLGDHRLEGVIRWSAAVMLAAAPAQPLAMLFQRDLRFGVLAASDVGAGLATLASSVGFALHGSGVYALVWGQLIGAAVRTLFLCLPGFPRYRPRLHVRLAGLGGHLRFGAYQMGERTINFLGFNLDKFLIGALVGAEGLGYYSMAYQVMAKPMQIFNPILTRVAFPLFAKLQQEDARLRAGYRDIMRLAASVLFPVYCGMLVLAEPLLRVLLGPEWLVAVPAFRLLCVLGMFYSIGGPIGSLLLAKGRVEIGLYLNVWMILLYATAVWVGFSAGVTGIAASLVIATAIGLFPVGFAVRWLLIRMRPWEYLAAILPALGCSLLTGAVVMLVMSALDWGRGGLSELAILACLGAMLYLCITAILQGRVLATLIQSFR